MEDWRQIPGLEFYEASTLGRIRSVDRGGRGGRILAPQVTGRRYPVVSISERGRIRTMPVHRLIASAFKPNPNNLPEVNHIDGDKLNACADNLEWCTRAENIAHAIASGLKPPVIGERHGQTKLTVRDVKEMRELRASGASFKAIASKYGVSASTAHRVVSGLHWGHVA